MSRQSSVAEGSCDKDGSSEYEDFGLVVILSSAETEGEAARLLVDTSDEGDGRGGLALFVLLGERPSLDGSFTTHVFSEMHRLLWYSFPRS